MRASDVVPLLDLKVSDWDSIYPQPARLLLEHSDGRPAVVADKVKGTIINLGSQLQQTRVSKCQTTRRQGGGIERFTRCQPLNLVPTASA
jgi:hypothetical protein